MPGIQLEHEANDTFKEAQAAALAQMFDESSGWAFVMKMILERIIDYDTKGMLPELGEMQRFAWAQRRLALQNLVHELYARAERVTPFDAQLGALYGQLERRMRLPQAPARPQAPTLTEQDVARRRVRPEGGGFVS